MGSMFPSPLGGWPHPGIPRAWIVVQL